MKRESILLIAMLLGSFVFASSWQINEKKHSETYYWYFIEDAPEEYQQVKGTSIYATQNNHSYRNLFSIPLKDEILNYLEEGKFEVRIEDNQDSIFLFPEILNINIDLSQEELKSLWKIFSKKYAGFSDMKKKGFTKKELLSIKTSDELKALLDKYIEDCHFTLDIREMSYSQNTAHDEGTSKSLDPNPVYFERETSNAYYVRFTNCSSKKYHENFENIYLKAMDKDFIILDARSNNGGSNFPQSKLRNSLAKKNYKGTVYVLQDNWSYSSGEVWEVFGDKTLPYTCKLVGTHSGGMQNYGNCRNIRDSKNHVSVYCGRSNFRKILPSNYLGEGKGYEPDIWATTQTMKSVLEGLGVDLTGIDFQ